MKARHILLIFVLSFSFYNSCYGFIEVKGEDWETLPTEYYLIHHKDAPYKGIRRVKRILEEETDRVARNLGSFPITKIHVFICKSHKEFIRLTGGTIPTWGSAVTYPKLGIIILGSYKGSDNHIRRVLTHELAHAIVGGIARDQHVPRWFFEGTAMWVSKKWEWKEGFRMNRAVLFRNLLSFSEIEKMFTLPTINVPLAYAESFFAIRYLKKDYGSGVFPRILWEMSRGSDFDNAFYKAAGTTLKRFENEVLDSASRFYGIKALVLYPPDLWISMAVLFLIAYLAVKYRNHKIQKKWKKEEELLASFHNYDKNEDFQAPDQF